MIRTTIEVPTLNKLREPFPDHQISKLPKETGLQAKQRKADQDNGKWPPKCDICGGFHHVKAVHLDYVGHAALTDRLLDVDPQWSWEPLAVDQIGLPAFDGNGGLWIKLTVCNVTRLGYGSADGKQGGDAKKEVIGDALRNAAMRFGAALDLWHKGDLHLDEASEEKATTGPETIDPEQEIMLEDRIRDAAVDRVKFLRLAGVKEARELPASKFETAMKKLNEIIDKAADNPRANANPQRSEELNDEIPY